MNSRLAWAIQNSMGEKKELSILYPNEFLFLLVPLICKYGGVFCFVLICLLVC